MHKSNASSCPTITCEEALKRELEYRQRIERSHPHLLVGLNGSPALLNEVGSGSSPDLSTRNSAHDSYVPSPQACFVGSTVQRPPANWYPSKKKLKVQQHPSQALQAPRPNLIPSFWCKICKVDCVTEFNFGAHIGGKKHKAKKLEILGNRKNARPATGNQCTGCSYNGEGAAPAIDPDWRSFRAQLYFNEQYAKSVNPAVAAVRATATTPEPVKIGDKWAHPLVEPEKGCLLIATEKLDGSHIFERTVVLLLSAGVLGPVGVILNRPSLMSIKEAQAVFAETDIAGAFSGRPLFFGGPLEECFFLLGPRAAAAGDVVGRTGLFDEVMPGVHYGTRESVGCAAELVKRGVVGVRDFRFFDGFCGWEREQLRDEVRAGLWRVAACSPAVLGLATVVKGGLWEEVQGLVGERRVW
uniref:C2H2-type domain-containing protein n=1 Tax=Oryza meridionalis TaxID=40149 RepID=A0A0E0EWP3_9ORYZ